MIASILMILLMGWGVYKILTSPIQTMKLIFKAAVIFVLGFMVWFGIFWLLMP